MRRFPFLVKAALLSSLLMPACAGAPKTVKKAVQAPKKVIKAATSVAEVQAAFDQAVQAMTAGDLVMAKEGFEAALKGSPQFAEAHYNLGLTLHRSHDYLGAESELKTAMGSLPNGHRRTVIMALGQLYLDTNRLTEAETMLQQALVANPDDLQVKHNLSVLYRRQKDWDTSLKFVREILAREPKNVGALNALGLLYFEQGNLAMAEWVYNKAVQFSEGAPNADVLNNLGLVWLAREKMPLAVSYFQKAAAASPTHVASRKNLGAMYLSYLNFPGATDAYTNALALNDTDAEARLGLASSLFGQALYDKAAQEYLKVVERDPRNATAYLRLGRLHEEFLQKQELALKYYSEYIRVANPPLGDPILQQVQFLEEAIKRGVTRMPEEPKAERPKAQLAPGDASGLGGVSIDEALQADPDAPDEPEVPQEVPVGDPAAPGAAAAPAVPAAPEAPQATTEGESKTEEGAKPAAPPAVAPTAPAEAPAVGSAPADGGKEGGSP